MSIELLLAVVALAGYVGFCVGVGLTAAVWRRRSRPSRGVLDMVPAAARGELDLDWDFGRRPADDR